MPILFVQYEYPKNERFFIISIFFAECNSNGVRRKER